MPVNMACSATVIVLRNENAEPAFRDVWERVIEGFLELQTVLDGAARDQHPVDFGGAVIDAGDAGVAVHPLQRQILAKTHSAEHLDGAGNVAALPLRRRDPDNRHLLAPLQAPV